MDEASFLNEIIREADHDTKIEIEFDQEPSSTAAGSSSAPQKRKRSQSVNPYPDAEVVALSPNTLQATNRFICEICNKGFQREQNLQLHRRSHNLPWKLKQKSITEVRRKVYLCPKLTCVHHDPSRALGDLTGIKKHYSRKHGEKKFKCEKCCKKYAVQSDWKVHSKTCGTREYRCHCGTLFSRRDSFVTHRAFCDALTGESARMAIGLNSGSLGLFPNHKISNPLSISHMNSQFRPLQDRAPSFSQMMPSPNYAFYLPGAMTSTQQQCQENIIKPYNFLVQHQNLHPSIYGIQNGAGFLTSSDQFYTNDNALSSGDLLADDQLISTSMHNYYSMNFPQIGTTATEGFSRNDSESMNMISMSSQVESNSKLKDLMYSLANGNTGICRSSYDHSSIGGNEMTRDFLGVGINQQISTLELELRSESSSTRPLFNGGGSLQ